MTRHHVNRLIEYNKEHGEKIRQTVLDCIKFSEKISPKEIKHHFDDRADVEVKKQYEKGEFSANVDFKNYKLFYAHPAVRKRVKEKRVTLRTIHRKLEGLTKEWLIENNGGEYSLSIRAKSDIRYFAKEIGERAIAKLMHIHHPMENTPEQNITKLVEIFGSIIVFCFIEAARPLKSKGYTYKISMSNFDKDKLAKSWIHNFVKLDHMFLYFLTALKNQLNTIDSKNKNTDKKEIIKQNHKSTLELLSEGIDRNNRRLKQFGLNEYEKGKPLYELDEELLLKATEAFKEVYPNVSDLLYNTNTNFTETPQQRSVNNQAKERSELFSKLFKL